MGGTVADGSTLAGHNGEVGAAILGEDGIPHIEYFILRPVFAVIIWVVVVVFIVADTDSLVDFNLVVSGGAV